ncbi:p-loop containing nucleoside triphosphate hydrolase [Venustampulla echinocandica]|uniref:RNA helicase n=1 Tax=Venustampulla echinocandica TaxID=2656787 RepID=A0A370TR86_9HELO|nr:p-loop containing nucleoside triphosphate hydrolase [Venustampulla echinocandica]RDL38031.1 p-loop containing nucleoside triphosphate hydrolase [Venustampulla echinocandica]
MAGGKKKKKPAANPARGVATTSIASKLKVEVPEVEPTAPNGAQDRPKVGQKDTAAPVGTGSGAPGQPQNELSPEEFERHLETSELQGLVEKHAQKTKRDALRQRTRLETDRRVLRNQAESLNTRKWLPPELMEEILDLLKAEGRFTGQGAEVSGSIKPASEEDLTIRLWTLQQSLVGAGFSQDKVALALRFVLDISDKISVGSKDAIWGMEEALEWLARECSREELPDYESWQRKPGMTSKSQTATPLDTPLPSGATTPRFESDTRHFGHVNPNNVSQAEKKRSSAKKVTIDYDSDIDPDDLQPVYLECKTKLFHLQQTPLKKQTPRSNGRNNPQDLHLPTRPPDPETSKILRKIKRIEDDVLFDQYVADQQWESKRIQLEKDAAARRSAEQAALDNTDSQELENLVDSDDEVSKEAAKIGAALLEETGSDDDAALADLFASLPVDEIDPLTGKSTTVINGTDGIKVTIRNFGKWTGVNPTRVLEEACRARDSTCRLNLSLVSTTSFSNRHSLQISWSKAQDLATLDPPPGIQYSASPKSQIFTMIGISTPDVKQSEAYIATVALFLIFSSSAREDKVVLRLPATWRDLWSELAEEKKDKGDQVDRESIRKLRDIIREKRDQELEDGVLLKGAFKNRGSAKAPDSTDESMADRAARSALTPEAYYKIWADKCSTQSYQIMLASSRAYQSRMQLPMWGFKEQVLQTIDREQVVIICGETGCGKSTQVPAFILEHELSKGKGCKIYCTEPRRISAISLARRVSEELGERKNDVGTSRSLVGYAIRLESNTSKESRLVYATTGIVMRMLEGSNDLRDITHIVLDEVHERTIDSDFLLIILRKLMVRRPDLKVVLMSATVDADRFSKYLDGAPVLNVPGRTFPVQVKYLEDAVELTGYSLDNGSSQKYTDLDDLDAGDVAVNDTASADNTKALRGYSAKTRNTIAQIDEYRIDFDLVTQLLARIATDDRFMKYSKAILVFLPGIGEIRQLNDMLVGHPVFSSNWYVYPLHSTIASEDQEAAFLVPPPGTRKIVLATNIAETGITIPDVTCVVDTGKHREMRFDERRQLSRLLETFISKANAKQRRGRAGRVQEGLCFHLFTKYRHDELMADQQTPELLRLSLQDLAIRVKICKLGGVEETLSEALDPPLPKNIRRAVDALIDVRALTPGEDLTPLGIQLARLPLDVFLGKLILLGSIFKCLDAVITIAAILSSKSPFVAPFGARGQADTIRLSFRRGDSDLLTVYNAYLAWKRVCLSNSSEFQFCRKNFLSQQTLSNIEDLKGQLVVSLVDSGFLLLTEAERSTLNRFYNAHETTAIEEFSIALLCGDVRCDLYAGVIILDGNRARFAVSDWKTMLAIKTLRARLRDIMTRSFKTPGKPLTAQQQKWMEVWQKIFSQEFRDK